MGPFATWCLIAALIVLILWLLYELANPAWVDDGAGRVHACRPRPDGRCSMTTATPIEISAQLRKVSTVVEGTGLLYAGAELGGWIDLLALEVAAIVRETAVEALVEAAEAWTENEYETHDAPDVAVWLRARAAGCTCGEAAACTACGAILCDDCGVGEPSRCDHGNGPFCVGCDVEACAGCAHELRMANAPFAGLYR